MKFIRKRKNEIHYINGSISAREMKRFKQACEKAGLHPKTRTGKWKKFSMLFALAELAANSIIGEKNDGTRNNM